MQRLNIVAASPESVRALADALAGFDVELLEAEDGGQEVTVTLGGSDREIVDVLNALEKYVTCRGSAARINLDGASTSCMQIPLLELKRGGGLDSLVSAESVAVIPHVGMA